MPNAGNGKRYQRHVKEWSVALREMANLGAEIIAPAHGAALTDADEISSQLNMLAEAFESIWQQTIDGLNAGLRKDQIYESVKLPEHLAHEYSLREQYATVKDISKMVLKRYTGWWNDIPSNWSPAPVSKVASTIVGLSGGIENLVIQTREVLAGDVVMASHMAEWAYYAEPDNPSSQQLIIDVYKARILDDNSNTQEMLAYLDIMAEARARQMQGGNSLDPR